MLCWLVGVAKALASDPPRAGQAIRLKLKSQEPWMSWFASVTDMVDRVKRGPEANRL